MSAGHQPPAMWAVLYIHWGDTSHKPLHFEFLDPCLQARSARWAQRQRLKR